MFSGLIETIGEISSVRVMGGVRRMTIEAPSIAPSLSPGDSVAVNGVCQTIIRHSQHKFEIEALGDTLLKSTLGCLRTGARVNLERALRLGDRLDGHLVQGHSQGMGRVLGWSGSGEERFLSIGLSPAIAEQVGGALIAEGSVAVDGVSLTIAEVFPPTGSGRTIRMGTGGFWIRMSLIPHTLANTTLGRLRPGNPVNLEADLLLRGQAASGTDRTGSVRSSISEEKLKSWGYA